MAMANEGKQLKRGYDYDIFLCIAAQDREISFIKNLSNALHSKGFNLLMIDLAEEEESGGEHICLSVLKLLTECKRSIVVVSKNFVASTYCLTLLVHILECKHVMSQLIFPIFYGLEPSFLKHYLGWVAGAFWEHYQNNGGFASPKVQLWHKTLTEVGMARRWYIKKGLGDEDQMKLIQETVQAIAHPAPRYDVFLSFCGEDTRYSFTGHLYRALCRKGLKTFMDDEGLVSGNEISNNLIEAIHSSKLSIVIFSENYPYSTWCLDELVEIVECKKKKNQLILPILYNLQKWDLFDQKKGYGKAMKKHEEKFGNNSPKVWEWMSVLSQVASIPAEHKPEDDYEHEFVNKIVEKAHNDIAVVMNQSAKTSKVEVEVEDESELHEYIARHKITQQMLIDGPRKIPAQETPSGSRPRLAPKPVCEAPKSGRPRMIPRRG